MGWWGHKPIQLIDCEKKRKISCLEGGKAFSFAHDTTVNETTSYVTDYLLGKVKSFPPKRAKS